MEYMTLIAQIVDAIIIIGLIYGFVCATRFFKDLKRRIKFIEENLNEIRKSM